MAEMYAISIDKEDIPYQFDIELVGEQFTFMVKYNELSDTFTVDLSKDGEVIVYGEPLVYGRPLFSAFSDVRLPQVGLVPFDVANKEERVSYENMNETVFLYVMEGGTDV